MDWGFSDQALKRKELGTSWRFRMMGCSSLATFVMLVNGSAEGGIKATRNETT